MKLYFVRLNGLDINMVDRYTYLVPRERRERIMRYRSRRDRLLSLAAGLLIQLAGKGEVLHGEHGKPYFADGSVHFSLSHAGSCSAIAISDSEVGLDVEEISHRVDRRIARQFHPNERAYIDHAEDPLSALIEIWTRKESYVKYTGTGIAVDLSEFDVTSPPLSSMIYTYSKDEYYISICCESDTEIEKREFSFEELLENAKQP